jgi:hypothetical protein
MTVYNRRYTQNPCSGHSECNRDISLTIVRYGLRTMKRNAAIAA